MLCFRQVVGLQGVRVRKLKMRMFVKFMNNMVWFLILKISGKILGKERSVLLSDLYCNADNLFVIFTYF